MDIGVTYYGTVGYPPNKHACYVRVSISRPGGVPLCIKATFANFDRSRFPKGTIVSVERTLKNDARRFAVTGIFGDCQGQTDRGDHDMSKSKDRVRFFIQHRYFQANCSLSSNGMRKDTCKSVLLRAFGMQFVESETMMNKFPEGFWVECRPSQFARFIVYRNDVGQCINGIKDLKPELIGRLTLPEKIARKTRVDINSVRAVMTALDWGTGLEPMCLADTIDVAGRFECDR